jgi:hypothetical protein
LRLLAIKSSTSSARNYYFDFPLALHGNIGRIARIMKLPRAAKAMLI